MDAETESQGSERKNVNATHLKASLGSESEAFTKLKGHCEMKWDGGSALMSNLFFLFLLVLLCQLPNKSWSQGLWSLSVAACLTFCLNLSRVFCLVNKASRDPSASMTFLVLALMNYCLLLIPLSKFSSCKKCKCLAEGSWINQRSWGVYYPPWLLLKDNENNGNWIPLNLLQNVECASVTHENVSL